MKIFNTMTKKKEEFVPLEEGKVKMYVCGPTVYNFIHIGNARPMIVFDTVRRYFEYKGYDVNYVSNFTDVDDKIIKKAIEEGVTADEISKRYIAECKKDMDGMNIKPATKNPLATEEICGMVDMIQTLIDKGYAYEKNGTVYYSTKITESFPIRTWMICVPESVLFWYPEKMKKKIHWTLYSGNQRKRENLHGNHHGARDVRDGTSSAQRCLRNISENRSTFMPAEKILYSRIMKMRLHRVRLQMARNLQNTGCTMHSLILTTGR